MKKLPLYPEMNEFGQISLTSYKNGITVTKFHSFFSFSPSILIGIHMTNYTKLPAILLLADGTVFYGKAAGKIGTTTGEICFNTGMTGYQEVFTDPSYFGQIMVTTNAHIGNYGMHKEEVKSGSIKIAGLVCKNYNILYSRKEASESIQDNFQNENIVGISEIDTRALVRHIRNKGAMNAIISSEITDLQELKKKLAEVPDMSGLELSSQVSTTEAYYYGNPDATYKIAALDLGSRKTFCATSMPEIAM